MKTCIVVPHYDHVDQFRLVLGQLVTEGLPLVVVDDASPEPAYRELCALLDDQAAGTTIVRHARNLGKGGAVMTGLKAALDAGYTHALQIDADGQHDVADIARFIEASNQQPDRIICGQPVFDESISRLRYYARYITLSLSWLESLSTEIRTPSAVFGCTLWGRSSRCSRKADRASAWRSTRRYSSEPCGPTSA